MEEDCQLFLFNIVTFSVFTVLDLSYLLSSDSRDFELCGGLAPLLLYVVPQGNGFNCTGSPPPERNI